MINHDFIWHASGRRRHESLVCMIPFIPLFTVQCRTFTSVLHFLHSHQFYLSSTRLHVRQNVTLFKVAVYTRLKRMRVVCEPSRIYSSTIAYVRSHAYVRTHSLEYKQPYTRHTLTNHQSDRLVRPHKIGCL